MTSIKIAKYILIDESSIKRLKPVFLKVSLGLSSVLLILSTNNINNFDSSSFKNHSHRVLYPSNGQKKQIEIAGRRFAGGDINTNGRTCSQCRKFKSWTDFSIKPKGLNGKDSRCRSCVVKNRKDQRKEKQKAKRRQRQLNEEPVLSSVVLGNLDQETITAFGQVLAQGICDLLEKGDLK